MWCNVNWGCSRTRWQREGWRREQRAKSTGEARAQEHKKEGGRRRGAERRARAERKEKAGVGSGCHRDRSRDTGPGVWGLGSGGSRSCELCAGGRRLHDCGSAMLLLTLLPLLLPCLCPSPAAWRLPRPLLVPDPGPRDVAAVPASPALLSAVRRGPPGRGQQGAQRRRADRSRAGQKDGKGEKGQARPAARAV